VLVGSGVYLADAPKAVPAAKKMTASELMTLVREGAAVFERHGEKVYAEFRKQGSKWFRDDTYFFVWAMDGTRVSTPRIRPVRGGMHVVEGCPGKAYR